MTATVTVGIPTFNRAALLREAIESVLAQTYGDFRLLVSDNASTDETPDVLASFSDSRLEYHRATENIGMIGNFNRLLALADTELAMFLPDDDRLYPDYLRSVVDVLQRNPGVGIAHTAFDEIGLDSHVQERPTPADPSEPACKIEPGHAFLERSMTSTITFMSTATFRTRAIRDAHGLKAEEEPFADVPLFMRIASSWDIAYLERPLAAFRVHDDTETARLAPRGEGEAAARNRLLTYGRIMFDRRIGFLDEATLPRSEANRYRALATLRLLGDEAGLGAPWLQTSVAFAGVVRSCPRILSYPMALRFLAAHCGGRALRRAAGWLERAVPSPRHIVRNDEVGVVSRD